MTHTLHRCGDRRSLEKDYVILAYAARGFNLEGYEPKFKQIAEIFAKHNPVNMMIATAEGPVYMAGGKSPQEIIGEISDKFIIPIAHAVYTDKEVVKRVLKELKEADLGISIVISGIFDEIFSLCKEVSIEGPFTVNMSLGIMGKTKRLPRQELLDITTMCGHALVSENLIKKQIEEVKNGKKTAEEAAMELARQCICGVFNPTRAAALIHKYMKEKTEINF
jgi:hypothetical protein